MTYYIEPLYAPEYSEEYGYLPTDELVGYELWDSDGKVVARAETREELLPIVYGIVRPPRGRTLSPTATH